MNILLIEKNGSLLADLGNLITDLDLSIIGSFTSFPHAASTIDNQNIDLIVSDSVVDESHDTEFPSQFTGKNIRLIYLLDSIEETNIQKLLHPRPMVCLVKPFDLLEIRSLLEHTAHQGSSCSVQMSIDKEDFFYIKNSKSIDRILYKNINYMKSDGNYVYIYTSEKKFIIKISLKKMAKKLPQEDFIQIHRAYYVNTKLLKGVSRDGNFVHFEKKSIPIGGKFKEAIVNFS